MIKIIGIIAIWVFILVRCTFPESEINKNAIESVAAETDEEHEDKSESDEEDMTDEEDEEENEIELEETIEKTEEIIAGSSDNKQEAKATVKKEQTSTVPTSEVQSTSTLPAVDAVSSASKTQDNSNQSVPSLSTARDTTTVQTAYIAIDTDAFKSVHGTSILNGLVVVVVMAETLDASMIANNQIPGIMVNIGFDEDNDDHDDD